MVKQKLHGCIESPFDLRDYKLKIASKEEVPSSFSIQYDHNVKSQGSIPSCVAHSVSSILESYTNNIKLSTNFIYGIRRKLGYSQTEGMHLREACKIVTKYGDMEEALCPGNNKITKVFDIAEEAFNSEENRLNALKYKAGAYVNLFGKEENIKYFLQNYGPVLAGLWWFNSDEIVDGELIFKDKSNPTFHSIVIYGWEDNKWLCQNSWGTKWGNSGLFKLDFSLGPREAFGLIVKDNPEDDIIAPTHKSEFLNRVFRIINYIVAKLFTKNNKY